MAQTLQSNAQQAGSYQDMIGASKSFWQKGEQGKALGCLERVILRAPENGVDSKDALQTWNGFISEMAQSNLLGAWQHVGDFRLRMQVNLSAPNTETLTQLDSLANTLFGRIRGFKIQAPVPGYSFCCPPPELKR